MEYDVFMSYSHQHDGVFAPALQTALERFAKPWYRMRGLRVFRDSTNLAANPSLWGAIEEALASSEWFLLLASAESAHSIWVEREVAWWMANRSPRRLLVIATSPGLAWDERQQDWSSGAPVPRALCNVPEEPLWVDLTEAQTAHSWRAIPAESAASVVAPIRGIPKDQLIGEQLRQHRRTMRLARAIAATLATLTVIAVVAALVAVAQRNDAVAQARIATARLAAVEAASLRDSDPRMSLLLSVASLRLAATSQARSGLVSTLLGNYDSTLTGQSALAAEAFSPDGRTLAVGSHDGNVMLWNVADPWHPAQLSILPGQGASVIAVMFNADGRELIVAGADGTVTTWDVADSGHPARLRKLAGANPGRGLLDAAEFSPDGRTLAVISYGGGSLSVWGLAGPEPRLLHLSTLAIPYSVQAAAFSPDGHVLAVAGYAPPGGASRASGPLTLWDLRVPAHPVLLRTIPNATRVPGDTLAFSPDGHILAVGAEDQSVSLLRVADPARSVRVGTITGFSGSMLSLGFSPDGHSLAAGGFDRTTIVWRVTDPARPVRLATFPGHSDTVSAVRFSPDGRTVASASYDGSVILSSTASGQPSRMGSLASPGSLAALAFSIDGHTLATGSFVAGKSGPSATNPAPLVQLTMGRWGVADPARPALLSSFNALSGDIGITGLTGLVFGPGGHILAAAGAQGNVSLWSSGSGQSTLTRLSDLTGLSGTPDMEAFTPSGRILAIHASSPSLGSADGGSVSLWNVADPAHPAILGRIYGVADGDIPVTFSPNGRILATAGAGLSISLWNVANPAQPVRLGSLSGLTHMAASATFSPNGSTLAIGDSAGTLTLWDVADPSHPVRLSTSTDHVSTIGAMAFSPGGHVLATLGQGDNTTNLWDVTSPAEPILLSTLRASAGQPFARGFPAVAFSPTGATLAADLGSSTYLWNVGRITTIDASPVALACGEAGTGPSPADWARYLPGQPYQHICPAP